MLLNRFSNEVQKICSTYVPRSNLQILDEIIKKGYDRRATPTYDLGTPTRVTIELFIPNIYISDIIDQDIMVK